LGNYVSDKPSDLGNFMSADTTNTAVNARSIDNPLARTGRNTRRTGAITGSVPAGGL
jgi:hypothetical protein